MPSPNHEKWMARALMLAGKGRFTVSPNPQVGACVVLNNKLIGTGYHEKFGGPHAEPNALANAGKKAEGATLYVTLEPCMTWEKTPPCAPLIKARGIRTVVIGCLDPNPKNRGKGVRYLRKAGIKVVTGVLEEEVRRQNEGFFKYITEHRPFVTLKMAQTMDGKIATRAGLSRWISSPPSREFVHRLREEHDAVLVGKNTFYQDDPRLTLPRNSPALAAGKPWKVAFVSEKGWSPRARIFQDERLTFLVFPKSSFRRIVKKGETQKGSWTLLPAEEEHGRVNIPALLKKFASLGITKLLVEGGGELAWSFLESGCVDRAVWIVAPKIFGGRDAKTSVEGTGVKTPNRSFSFKNEKIEKCGEDWIFFGKID